MRANFDKAVSFTILKETGGDPNGGYSNNALDPGGETKWGISKRYHPDVDIKNLTEEGAKTIYLSEYWIKAGCDSLPWPLDMVVFDSAVNPGIGFALETLRTTRDFRSFLLARTAYYLDRVKENPKVLVYLHGWLQRICDLWRAV